MRELVTRDPSAALEVAREVTEPWYRCQALANVAEHLADPKKRLRVLENAFEAADETGVRNRIATVASWPLRVLANCGTEAQVLMQLRRLLEIIEAEPHPIRRMDGQAALFSAVSTCGPEPFELALAALLHTIRHAHGWRRDQALASIADWLIHRGEVARGWRLIDECEAPRELRRARKRLEARFGPRPS